MTEDIPSAAPSALDEAREQIRDLGKAITELGSIVYAPGEPLTTWKARALKAEAALASPSAAQPETLVEARALLKELETWHANDAGDRAIRLLRRIVHEATVGHEERL
jgi:hypothetical protein